LGYHNCKILEHRCWLNNVTLQSLCLASMNFTTVTSMSGKSVRSGRKDASAMMMLAPVLTPHGLLTLGQAMEAEESLTLEPGKRSRLERAFVRGSGHGLLVLGAEEVGTPLPPVLCYWRNFAARYVTALCARPGIVERTKLPVPIPVHAELDILAAAVPPMAGAEYLTTAVLANLWSSMDSAFDTELGQSNLTVQEFLKSRHPAWNLVGRGPQSCSPPKTQRRTFPSYSPLAATQSR
jgi:hypothetical protein